MRDMLEILRAVPKAQLVRDIIGMVALVAALYGFTVVASGMIPPVRP